MGKQPVQGQKKSKDAISKAASQKKAPTKVCLSLVRNGPRAKSKKKPITQSFSTRPLMINTSPAFPRLASTSLSPILSTSLKSWAPSPELSSRNALRTVPLSQSRSIADKPCSLQSLFLRSPSQQLQLLQRERKVPRRERRNDPVSTFE